MKKYGKNQKNKPRNLFIFKEHYMDKFPCTKQDLNCELEIASKFTEKLRIYFL